MISFDKILLNRIGFGYGQWLQFSILCLVDFFDGFVSSFCALLISLLTHQWNLSLYQIMGLGLFYFIGMFLGLITQGFYSDAFGRKNMLLCSMFCNFLITVSHAFVQTYTQILIIRLGFGYLMGISLPLALIIISEQIPYPYRGRIVAALQMSYLFGMYYMLICAYIYLDDFEVGNWRAVFLLNSIPAFFFFLGGYFILHESPRLMLSKQQYPSAFKRLNQLGKLNDQNYQNLTMREKNGLILWQQNISQSQSSKKLIDLFLNGQAKTTINLWIIMFLWGIQCTSIFLLIPFILKESGGGLFAMALGYLWEFPATLIVIWLIDKENYGGRKRIVAFGLIMYSLSELIMYKYGASTVIVGMVIIRMSDKIVWISLNQLKIESYSTNLRTLGVGMADALARTGSIFATGLAFYLFFIDTYLPFIVFGLMTQITILLVCIHPVDLTSKPLDQNHKLIKD